MLGAFLLLSALALWAAALWLVCNKDLSSQVPLAILPAFVAYRPCFKRFEGPLKAFKGLSKVFGKVLKKAFKRALKGAWRYWSWFSMELFKNV